MNIIITLAFALLGFWGSYAIGFKAGKAHLWNTLAKTPRQSLRDLL